VSNLRGSSLSRLILAACLGFGPAIGIPAARVASALLLPLGLALAAPTSPALALDNGLARTPYMGWNTYYGLGGTYNEQTIVSVTDAMVNRGLAAAGYTYVWLDAGWWSGTRDASGNITVDATQWPHGMAWLAGYIHSKGLKAGIYTDAGSNGCGGANQGSYGHYQQDANQFASWGFDALKVDFCGGHAMRLDPATAYGQFRDALLNNSSHRPILFNICNFLEPGQAGPNDPPYNQSAFYSYTFGPSTGNSWRTDTDIGFAHSVQWPAVLRNLDHDAAHPEAAGPGHWNDPDYLGPELGMTAAEAQAQFTMWSIVAAPLIIGSDVRALSAPTVAMLTNPDVIAVDQDALGAQSTRIAQQGNGDVWVKTLANGDRAVALLNRGPTALTISTSAADVGLGHAAGYTLQDLWAHRSTETAGRITATVAPDSAVLYRVSAGYGNTVAPATSVSAPGVPAAYPGSQLRLAIPEQSMPVSSTFENDGRTSVTDARIALAAPPGWQVQAQSTTGGAVGTNEQRVAQWMVTPPAGALPGSYALTVTATYRWGGNQTDSRSAQVQVTVPPAPPAGTGYLSDHTWLDASSGYLVPMLDVSVGGNPITLQGHTYPKGIGVASPSQIEYYFGGNCAHLSATVGIDDIVNSVSPQGGTAVFQVYGDGRKLYDSGVVDRTATKSVEVDLTGVNVLTLAVGDAGDGGYNDRADWAGLQASCGNPVATVPGGPWPHFVPQASMSATASSAHAGYPASAAIDGRQTTIWHSEFSPPAPLPQSITIDLGGAHTVAGLTYQPRLDASETGTITGYVVYTSVDGTAFSQAASGVWPGDRSLKSVTFNAPQQARYVRIEATSGAGNYASAAEIQVADVPAGAGGGPPPSTTPELGSGDLFASGLIVLGLGVVYRRRRTGRAPRQ